MNREKRDGNWWQVTGGGAYGFALRVSCSGEFLMLAFSPIILLWERKERGAGIVDKKFQIIGG